MRVELSETRYARQELITWWDQNVLAAARVLIVGAGALGNELAKNFALVGVGQLTIVDLDEIDISNLSRCVLFRADDAGQPKAEVAAAAVRDLNPDITVVARQTDVMSLGLGTLADHDLIVAGLDNRAARAWLNQATRKMGLPWVDGAIEGLRGLARVFMPDGPCYECTLGEVDRQLLAERRSCALLSNDDMLTGKVPTTATSASIIAAVQAQEAIKLLHGRADLLALRNTALMYVGETLETYTVAYGEDPDCMAHDHYEAVQPYPLTATTTMAELFGHAEMIEPVAADLESDVVVAGRCTECDTDATIERFTCALTVATVTCPGCDQHYALDVRGSISPDDPVATIPLVDLGLPDGEVVTVRDPARRAHYLLRT